MQKLDIDYSKAPNTLEELNKVVAHHFPHMHLVPDVNVFHLRSEDPATKAKIEAIGGDNLYTGHLGGGVHHFSYQRWVDFIQAIFDGNTIHVQAYPANPDQQNLNIDYSQQPLRLENLNKVVAHHFPHVRLEEEGNRLTLHSDNPAMQAKIDNLDCRYITIRGGSLRRFTYEEWVKCIQGMLDNAPPKVEPGEELPF